MRYPIYKPYLPENTKKYVNDCIESTWISSKGKYVRLFEEAVENFCGVKYASSVFNGTVALHVALVALDIGPGDEVIVPDFTYIATANAVRYTGASPILVDVSRDDWNITLEEIEKAYNERVKAIIVVDIYGLQPKNLDKIRSFANEKGIYLVQDAAESFGSIYKKQHIGAVADITTLSFFGNKTITTGEGGMVLTNHEGLRSKIEVLKNQGNSKTVRYFHDVLGYNYRMTNIQAAIGLAQMEVVHEILQKKQAVLDAYQALIGDFVCFQEIDADRVSSNWLVSVILQKNRDDLMDNLQKEGIETRPFFHPISSMPFYERRDNPVAYQISAQGISFPSYSELTKQDIEWICKKIRQGIGG